MSNLCRAVLIIVFASVAFADEAPATLSERDKILLRHYGPHYPVGEDQHADIHVMSRLLANPNDAFAIRRLGEEKIAAADKLIGDVGRTYAAKGLDTYQSEMKKALWSVDLVLSELELVLNQLPGETPSAMAAIKRARLEMGQRRHSVAIHRIPMEECLARARQHPANGLSIGWLRQKLTDQICVLELADPFAAFQLINEVEQVIDEILEANEGKDEQEYISNGLSPEWMTKALQDDIKLYRRQLQRFLDERVRLQVRAGMEAVELPVDAHVNGHPEPAIATLFVFVNVPRVDSEWFAQLSRLHREYSERGLRVRWVTSYHNLRWNASDQDFVISNPGDGRVLPNEEKQAWQTFCKIHGLPYPVSIMRPEEFIKADAKYGQFSGSPGIVLVDGGNTVRLVRIWRGASDTKTIDDAVEQILSATQ